MLGLRTRVATLVGATAVVTGLSSAALLSRSEERRLMEHLRAQTIVYTAIVQEALGPDFRTPGSERAPEDVQEFVQRMTALSSVSWLEVFDGDARVVAHSDPDRIGSVPLPSHARQVGIVLASGEPVESMSQDRRLLTRFIPLRDPKGTEPPVGVVELVLETSDMEVELDRHWRAALWIVFSAAGMSCLALFATVDFQILRPIEELVRRTQALGGPTPAGAEANDSKDELRHLDEVVTRYVEVLESRVQVIESRYRDLLSILPCGVEELDPSGRVIYANRTRAKMLDYESTDGIEGRFVWDLLADPRERDELRDSWSTLVRERPRPEPHFGTNRTADGRSVKVQVDWTYRVDEHDELLGVLAVVTDITARVEADRQLRESETMLRGILDNMPVMMVATGDDGKLVMWNRECERVTGYSARETLGLPPVADIFYPDPATAKRVRDEWFRRRGDYRNWETEILCRRGRRRTVAWSSASKETPIPGWESWSIGIDVTERVEAERALRASEETLRSITDSTPDVLMILDLDGTIRFVNHPHPGLTKEAMIGSSSFDYSPEHMRERVKEYMERVVSEGKTLQFDGEFQSPDGTIVPYDVRLAPICENGQVVRLAASCSDVSERRRAEDRFKAQYKHFPLPSYIYQWKGDDLALVDFNDAAYDVTDGRISSLLGKSVHELYGDYAQVPDDFYKCFRERTVVRRAFRYKFITTGREHELDATYVFVPPDYVILYAEHIDERKTAEEALRRSQESLTQAQRIAHLGNWEWDIVADELRWSDEIYRIFGLEPQEFGATYEAFLATVHPDDRAKVMSAVERALRDEEPYLVTHRVSRRDGAEVIVHEQAEVTFDEEGSPIRMLGTVQDVTQREQAERQLKAALEEKETLLREVHHRVKNNLQVISSLLYLQSRKVEELKLKRLLDEMEQRVKTMALIHENLYKSTDLGRVDLRRYLEMLLGGLRSAYAERPIRIESNVDDISLNIQSAVPCGLIANELVTNALLHAFRGRGEGLVQVDFHRRNGEYALLVRDDGCGLPSDFDVARSTSLGLRLVVSLTEQLGGRLETRGVGGAEFRITFDE